MTIATSQLPFGIVGVFLVLLGAGLVLDANWLWRGSMVAALGVYCLVVPQRDRSVP